MDGMKVERIIANSGDAVFKFGGRLTASAMDPRREARDWVNRWRDRIAVAERLIVLGFGSGYHLSEINREWPTLKILAIGCEQELLTALVNEVQFSRAITFILCENETELLAQPEVRQFMRTGFAILEHSSLPNLNAKVYAEIKERLLAREPLFFSDWVRREPRLTQLFPLQAIPGGDARQALSIKDLERFISGRTNAKSKDAMIVRALRELVR